MTDPTIADSPIHECLDFFNGINVGTYSKHDPAGHTCVLGVFQIITVYKSAFSIYTYCDFLVVYILYIH